LLMGTFEVRYPYLRNWKYLLSTIDNCICGHRLNEGLQSTYHRSSTVHRDAWPRAI
jgi:hypothetical protein